MSMSFFKQAITAGGKETMPVSDQFWGDRYGSFVDPFGHSWGGGHTQGRPEPWAIGRTRPGVLRQPDKTENSVRTRGVYIKSVWPSFRMNPVFFETYR